jgi:predicted DNA-binding transcriptional regulator YafY
MNRFDRITAILLQLQARRVVSGPALAERFGVSLRTIYRDLRTLELAGCRSLVRPAWATR